MWFTETKPIDFLDRKRMVTLNVGQLVDAIAEALRVVEDAPEEPKWKAGDRAYVEVEVTGTDKGSVNFKFADWKGTASFALGAHYLKEIEE
ncbi:hypothetical protein [Afipia felis]|uniref:Uncharacterized protein n=2 Tax=Afipia felis TaxID=1035 RepID=A0A380WAP9_AFIFE|nr:hypothetical protein [Afipia felis]EKS29297.1 hypothetical protein HMPREF9697_01825 [Afipia felis ATCC 53690]SUU78005.1 Uncharacterised protein [Afipia felis]SUU86070.1 Uncharacterised protein [Afipia felis]